MTSARSACYDCGIVAGAQRDGVVEALVESHRRFLAFLERHVESREVAEEILQEAFVKALRHGEALGEVENATAWFFALLRNALTDHFRRRAVARRGLDRLEAEPPPPADEEIEGAVCQCLHALLPALKPEYAQAVQRADLDGLGVSGFAEEAGIAAGNARVRLHRARKALAEQLARACGTCATHGCLDCTCAAY